MRFNARIMVILGFFLGICLIVGVGAITYFSVTKLLASVESLSEPNEKLRNLNQLLADIYQLDKSRSVFVEEDTSHNLDYYNQIQNEIKKLEAIVTDSTELKKLKGISYSVNELMVVYKGLEDVKRSLYNRNFSNEALYNIERKIKRKEELSRLQNLGKIRIGIDPSALKEQNQSTDKPPKSLNKEVTSSGTLAGDGKEDMDKIKGTLRLNLNRFNPVDDDMPVNSDSIIYTVRQMVLDINNEEQYLRSRLSELEQELNEKNRELIMNIQSVVTSLQNESLLRSKAENDSAYELTYKLSILLGVLIAVGVVGSSGFIYSIIREIKKAEAYQEKLAEAKRRSDNLAKTKQDFLASMSHEIRNPLHVIQGYNEALLKTNLGEAQTEYVRMIQFASGTLLGIVNDILDFSKLEAGKIKIEKAIIDPDSFFKDIHSFFKQKAIDNGLSLEFSVLLPKNKYLLGDDLRINQIMNNLLSNAVKFTEKGEVSVRVFMDTTDNLVLEVSDTGMGMEESLQANLFKEFSQGDATISRKYGGTGLGLAIVKKLVDLQKGKIAVASKTGVGTKITVSIPATLLDKKEENIVPEVDSTVVGNLKVLLVDDDEMGLKFTNLLFNGLGAEVVAYTGGIEFMNNFVEEDFDLVLLDIQMPEIDGYQVFKALRSREKYRQVPIVAMTANVFTKDRESMINEGFNGVLLKPFNEAELVKIIVDFVKPQKEDVLLSSSERLSPSPSGETEDDFTTSDYNLVDIRKFCMGDEALFKEVVEGFYTQTGLDLIMMNKACDEEDYETIRSIAHQLSSRLGQIQFKFKDLAKEIEVDLKRNKTQDIQEKVWALTEKINTLLEDLAVKFGYELVD
ncbi:ATP-binding protein [Cyclobacterium marinum]|uniref:histidine kinase n=1 Tax=Cyclobacterium marinum (strain ATCC 25205 / DSM 745 / LMG 13164 / NCIMB 1802) TaxID=880070 RepID=G0J1C1_CYCMS|nr:ATP-binding protein [Cyclobacterium marinum]AEL26560.1 histidine kinase [Cyclobacterium marinum DSM 745]